MKYRLIIELKKNINLNDSGIMELLNYIEEEFNIEERDFIFLKNQNINEYNENKLNSNICYTISSNDKSIENKVHEYLYSNSYISKYKLELVSLLEKSKNNLVLKPTQIDNLLDGIDKIFYILNNLEKYEKNLADKLKGKYKKDIKKLNDVRQKLKQDTIELRLVDSITRLEKLRTRFSDYAKNIGVDLNFRYSATSLKLDKLVFSKIETFMKDFVYTLIEFEKEKRKKELIHSCLEFNIEFIQDFNKLQVNINCNHLEENEIYKTIFNNDFEILSNDEEIREQQLAILNVYNLMKDLGEIKFSDENSLELLITLDFFLLNSIIVESELGNFAIDSNYVVDIEDFDKDNVVSINNINYYKLGYSHLPIIKSSNEIKKLLVLRIEKHNYVFLVKDVLLKEEIFVRPLDTKPYEYLGYAILKDGRKVLLLNLKSYI